MDDQSEILEQGVQIRAIGRHIGQQTVKGIGGDNDKQQEADTDHAQHREHLGNHHRRQATAEDSHRQSPARQHQNPEQQ